MTNYKVGDVLIYKDFGGTEKCVRINKKYSNIKNGRPGFDATIARGSGKNETVWGYDYQIIEVLKVG
jgi:hypothetical protein